MKDKKGRPLTPQQQSRPRWPGPFDEPVEVAGFTIKAYLGYFRRNPESKGFHKYLVNCTICGNEYERVQASLMRGVAKGTQGCMNCARQRHKHDVKIAREAAEREILESMQLWLWALFLMPVTSLEVRKPFDTEKAKVLGWRTI